MVDNKVSNSKMILELVKEFFDEYGEQIDDSIDNKISHNFIIDLGYYFEFDLLKDESVVKFIVDKNLESDLSNKEWIELNSATRLFIKKLKNVLMKELRVDSYDCSNGLTPSIIKVYVSKTSKFLLTFVDLDFLYNVCSKMVGWFLFPFYVITAILYLILCFKGIWVFRPISAFSRVFPFLLMVVMMNSTKCYLYNRLSHKDDFNAFTDKDVTFGILSFSCILAYCNLLEKFNELNKLDLPSILVLVCGVVLPLYERKNIHNWLISIVDELICKVKDLIFIFG